MNALLDYDSFLAAKVAAAPRLGFDVAEGAIHPALKPHCKVAVRWALAGGCRAIFASFGLHKTSMQLEMMRQVLLRDPAAATLIVCPLGVRQEFTGADAARVGVAPRFIRSPTEIVPGAVHLTNYETVRDGKLDPALFAAVSLDEASVLRGFGGSKTFREFMRLFEAVRLKFVATATPSPNQYIELLAYAAFLGVMDVGQAKTRWFRRNSEKADELTIHPHKEKEFWTWVATWALFIQKPSNICDCSCHHAQRLKAFGSAVSLLSNGNRESSGMGLGAADATAAETASRRPITCSPVASEAVGAFERSTALRKHPPIDAGDPCSIVSTGIGRTTAAEAYPSANDGESSSPSTRTWDSRQKASPSNVSTTTVITSQATAVGRHGKSKLETLDVPSSSHMPDEANPSRLGPKSVGLATGNYTQGIRPVGLPTGCSETFCPQCKAWDDGYELPALDVRWHEVSDDGVAAEPERDGQGKLFADAAVGVSAAARVKRDSLDARVAKLMAIRAEDPAAHRILWHDLEKERAALEAAIPGVTAIWGSQDLDERERRVVAFSNGEVAELAAKPVIAGSGCNFQRHCSWAVFLGIGFKFNDFVQAIHRIQRFGQTRPVRIDLIYAAAERGVRRDLEAKWRRDTEQRAIMAAIIRENGLTNLALGDLLQRSMGVERVEASGEGYRCIHNDCVVECRAMAADSVDLIVTSIPFSTQYEYSPSFNDFGHTDDDAHFWRQMDFLTPELLRVLKPGRVAAIHVKDRITPGGINGLGFQTVSPFSDDCVAQFRRHGWAFLARKTIVTDVVRENAQTYRLGWSELCKDGSRMGAGMPEYLLLFRKPQTDRSKGYADLPVVKSKERYTRGRWQFDAHGFGRSSGDRTIALADLVGVKPDQAFKAFRRHSLEDVYDFEFDVSLADGLAARGQLPPDFMLLQPQSWHPDVWTDVTRMRTLNGLQAAAGREMHLCPLQFDVVDRAVEQFTMPGETVLDPFGGLMTVPYRAVALGRRGIGIELSAPYWRDGATYCEAAARKKAMPSLFDLLTAAPALVAAE